MGTHPIFESDFDCLTDKFCVDAKTMKIMKLLTRLISILTMLNCAILAFIALSQLKYGIRLLTFGDNSKRDEVELVKQAMMIVTIIASALICNDYGLCLKQMNLVRRKNSLIEKAEFGETTEDVVESKFEAKIMEELDEYVTVDAIHDECLNAALSFDAFDFENVSFEGPCQTPLESPASPGILEDSIEQFTERYVSKIIADACEAIKPKKKSPLRVSARFAEIYIENLMKEVVKSRANERKYERAVSKLGDIDLDRFSILN